MATKGHVVLPGTGERINCLVYTRAGNAVYNQLVAGILADVDDDDLIVRHIAAGTLQAVPHAAPTALVGVDCKLARLFINNPTAGLLGVTVTDGQGSPLELLAAQIAPGDVYARDLGVKMLGGVQWQASGPGLRGFAVVYTA